MDITFRDTLSQTLNATKTIDILGHNIVNIDIKIPVGGVITIEESLDMNNWSTVEFIDTNSFTKYSTITQDGKYVALVNLTTLRFTTSTAGTEDGFIVVTYNSATGSKSEPLTVIEKNSASETYNEFRETLTYNNSRNLNNVNILNTVVDASFNVNFTSFAYMYKIIITIVDIGIDSGYLGNFINPAGYMRLYYKKNNTDSKHYLTDELRVHKDFSVHSDFDNRRNAWGSGEEFLTFVMKFNPVYIESTGEVSMEFNATGANPIVLTSLDDFRIVVCLYGQ